MEIERQGEPVTHLIIEIGKLEKAFDLVSEQAYEIGGQHTGDRLTRLLDSEFFRLVDVSEQYLKQEE
jgi:hypothetical protein